MLNLLWEFMEDDAATESRLLAEMLKQHPELPDWSAAVQPLLDRILRANDVKRPLTCRVLSGMPFNAMALSHQTIVIAESLVDFCRGQTPQMAFVVAHEVSHLYRGHARERSRAGTMAGMLVTANPLVAFGVKTMLDRGCSRENEFEADRDAVTFCHRVGWSASGGVEFLQRLASGELPKGVIQQLLGTHPPLSDRLAELRVCVKQLQPASAE